MGGPAEAVQRLRTHLAAKEAGSLSSPRRARLAGDPSDVDLKRISILGASIYEVVPMVQQKPSGHIFIRRHDLQKVSYIREEPVDVGSIGLSGQARGFAWTNCSHTMN